MNLRDLLLTVSLAANAAFVAAPAQDPQGLQLGQSRPEHQVLALFAGDWKAKSRYKDEDLGEYEALGREEGELICNGKWLVQDLEATVLGAPYRGHGILGFDPAKRRYVGVWVDDQLERLSLSEGAWDPDRRQLTMYASTLDHRGKAVPMKQVTTFGEDGKRHEEVFVASADGERSIYETSYERER